MSVMEQTLEKSKASSAASKPSSVNSNLGEAVKNQTFLDKLNSVSFERGPKRKDILNFTNQLSVMVRAGISLQDGMESIAAQTQNRKFKEILTQIKEDIESGQSFSQALANHPKQFSNLYINMVAAAELSGS